jgi:hypothetical protein
MLLRGWGDAVGRARAGDKGRGSSHFANFARRDESGNGVDASGKTGSGGRQWQGEPGGRKRNSGRIESGRSRGMGRMHAIDF